jgi:hypothetical protein
MLLLMWQMPLRVPQNEPARGATARQATSWIFLRPDVMRINDIGQPSEPIWLPD